MIWTELVGYVAFNFIMEAVIIGSRSINQDLFREKERETKYKKHIDSISTITNQNLRWGQGWEA